MPWEEANPAIAVIKVDLKIKITPRSRSKFSDGVKIR